MNEALISEYHKFTKLKKRFPNPIPVGMSLNRVDAENTTKLSYTVPVTISYCPQCEKLMKQALAE